MTSAFRAIPSVDRVLQSLDPLDVPRPLVAALVRRELGKLRGRKTGEIPGFEAILAQIRVALDTLRAGRIQAVINGTGIVLHTNLGRAPLSKAAVDALTAVAANYSNLEYDLITGERGSRAAYLEHSVALLCGAEAATVVNNCAAALVLMLRHFTRGEKKEAVISRGELVQIGGGFRIPEILEASGARLREVGTTNQTAVADYAAALGPATALILKVHRSNFYQAGFTSSPTVSELTALGRKRRLPVAEDLGSGSLVPTDRYAPLEHERTPAEAIHDGVDLVCFSGDKLLGGPQSGLLAGRARRITALKRDPFFRILRCDKLVLATLQATTDLYLHGRDQEIPALEMMRFTPDELRPRAHTILDAICGLPLEVRIVATHSRVGGGTLPRALLPSLALDFRPTNDLPLSEFAVLLRTGNPPVIGYISNDRFRLDLRTVHPHQDGILIQVFRSLFPSDSN